MKYCVLVTNDITESAYVEVEAESEEEAAEQALDQARTEAVGWEVNDGSKLRPYLGDPENDVEKIETIPGLTITEV